MRSLLVAGLLATVMLTGCQEISQEITINPPDSLLEKKTIIAVSNHESRLEEPERIKHISLASVGDIMVHRTQLIKAFTVDEFDFSSTFREVTPILSDASLTVGNLETTFGGYLGQRKINVEKFCQGYSGYPCFNTPDVFAKAIKEAGFDLVSTANNHTLDSKEVGVRRTLDILDSVDLEHIGTYKTLEEAQVPYMIEVEGVTFAFINYTYGLNGFRLKEADRYMVNSLDMYQKIYIEEMNEKVREAEATGADFVVVMLHYGNEYVTYPDKYYQKPLVKDLFNAGADIILGGHPHVLQPFEVRTIIRENGEEEICVVIYSLGNFLSSQRSFYNKGANTDIGIIFEILIEQVEQHKPSITGIAYVPTITHWAEDGIMVVPTTQVSKELELTQYEKDRIIYANHWVPEHMSYFIKTPPVREGIYYQYKW